MTTRRWSFQTLQFFSSRARVAVDLSVETCARRLVPVEDPATTSRCKFPLTSATTRRWSFQTLQFFSSRARVALDLSVETCARRSGPVKDHLPISASRLLENVEEEEVDTLQLADPLFRGPPCSRCTSRDPEPACPGADDGDAVTDQVAVVPVSDARCGLEDHVRRRSLLRRGRSDDRYSGSKWAQPRADARLAARTRASPGRASSRREQVQRAGVERRERRAESRCTWRAVFEQV